MTERKPPTAPEGSPSPACTPEAGCPLCRVLWPSSRAGKVVVLVVLLAAVGVITGVQLLRSGVERDLARYDTLKRAGRNDEAGKALDKVIRRGIALYEARRFEESLHVLEKVIEREPLKPLVLNYLGLMEGALGDEQKAVQYFEKAVEIDPLSAPPYWNLALIHYKRKDFPACEEQLRLAMKYAQLKAQYRLLYALCAVERKLDRQIIVGRLRDTVLVAAGQAESVGPEDLAPGGSLEKVFAETANRLASYGDEYAWDRLKRMAAGSESEAVRAFAARLLAGQKNR